MEKLDKYWCFACEIEFQAAFQDDEGEGKQNLS